jgi:hypothetical protein
MPIEDIISDDLLTRLRYCQKTVTKWIAVNRPKLKHIESTCEAISDGGDEFQIYMRQSQILVDNFSCGIKWKSPDGAWITLARYNGSSHTHENKADGRKIVHACHVHQITVEAVLQCWDHENYATATELYSDLDGAKLALSADFSINGLTPNSEQLEIWN